MKLRDIPIQRKLTTIIMLTTSMVLALTCAAFVTYEIYSFRRTLVQEMKTVAEVVAANSTAAVAFNDETAAREILTALQAEENILIGALYDANGTLLAHYPADVPSSSIPAMPLFIGHTFQRGSLVLVEPVERANTRIGTLYLLSDLDDIYNRLALYGLIVALVLGASFLFAFLLSRWLQRSISGPILELAKTAKKISEKKDYSVRAQKLGEDELGVLTEAFNDMLLQIDTRSAQLLASRERLKLALSASQTGTWEWNLTSNKMFWDEFTERLFGLSPGSFTGHYEQLIQLFHREDRDMVTRALEATLRYGKALRVEGRVVWPDGSEHHLALKGTAVTDGAGSNNSFVSRVMGVCLDITDRKRAEERIRSMNVELEERVMSRTAELTASHQEMEAFTYSVSHDLRAPLRHITAFAEILDEEHAGELSDEARDYLRRIIRGTHSMSQLVDDLLNLARVGRQGLSLQKADINEIVQEVIAEFQPELKQRRVRWVIHDIPKVYGDPGLIRQVFANLISNAIKYTRPKSEATIKVGAEVIDGEIVIHIRDNGVGFNMKFADKLFGVFQRLHRSEDFEGTGVGLALVERIVRKHGGRIWAESELNHGATFYFTLPASEKAARKPVLAIAGKNDSHGQARVWE